ncbi:MAG: anthranilate phosphoribosyltransferase, partial [Nocardioidaceae bacterium]
GDDGLDELTTTTTSQVWSIVAGSVRQERLDPAELGLRRAEPADLKGGDVGFNVDVVRRLVDGDTGPVRDAVLLNAAAGIAAYDISEAPLVTRLRDGLERAAVSIDSGAAKAKLADWIKAVTAA